VEGNTKGYKASRLRRSVEVLEGNLVLPPHRLLNSHPTDKMNWRKEMEADQPETRSLGLRMLIIIHILAAPG
jgi:hypothetical protein